ncbi:uncharacterized protein Fot_42076 [Forsythia ovata]|uniref:Retrotransposon Copia-like N-terminal domain-containing protein n=1 Tax=Forsythia ovata TaxID=205694 RepID=A0ABD1RNY8_9LAMI
MAQGWRCPYETNSAYHKIKTIVFGNRELLELDHKEGLNQLISQRMVGNTYDNFKIALEKLSGRSNYDSWARIAHMSIANKKKLGYIIGMKKAPEKTDVQAYEI